jgi:hypothetical protein
MQVSRRIVEAHCPYHVTIFRRMLGTEFVASGTSPKTNPSRPQKQFPVFADLPRLVRVPPAYVCIYSSDGGEGQRCSRQLMTPKRIKLFRADEGNMARHHRTDAGVIGERLEYPGHNRFNAVATRHPGLSLGSEECL